MLIFWNWDDREYFDYKFDKIREEQGRGKSVTPIINALPVIGKQRG